MSMRRWLILVLVGGGMQLFAIGQNPPSQNPPGQNSGEGSGSERTAPAPALTGIVGMQSEGEAEDASSTLPQIPSFLGGEGINTTVLSKMDRSNYLRGGVNVGAVCDDNPLLVSIGQTSNTSESIFPNIRIEESTSRTRWSLGYAGRPSVNQKIPSQNQGSHSLIFDSHSRLSPHVNLRVAETF